MKLSFPQVFSRCSRVILWVFEFKPREDCKNSHAMGQELDVIALAKALPLSIALTLIAALIISPYGPYAVFLRVEPMNLSYFDFDWSWPIFAMTTLLAWIFFRIFEIR